MVDSPRIVTLDIETAPLDVYTWGIWEQNIGLDQIKQDWTILSFSAKWLGEKKVTYIDTGGRGRDRVREDGALLQALWDVLNEADIVIAQNGQSFDIKKINARLLLSGFEPYSPIKIIDTMLVAKQHFALTSNRLAWLSAHLTKTKKSPHKKFPGFELWAQCLKDNPKAWAEMKRYNIADTTATEELYLVLRPWIAGHPNVAAYSEFEIPLCPKCGGKSLQKRGHSVTQFGEYHRFQCMSCGGWSRARQMTNTRRKRASLLAN